MEEVGRAQGEPQSQFPRPPGVSMTCCCPRERGWLSPSSQAPGMESTELSLACPTPNCLARSAPPHPSPLILPAPVLFISPPELSKQLCHQSHLPPGQCKWLAQPEPSGQEEPQEQRPGGWKEKGVCRVQAGTCGPCDHSLGLVQIGMFCSRRNPATCTCYMQGPVEDTKGALVQWEEKVCSLPKVEGERPKDPEGGDSLYCGG